MRVASEPYNLKQCLPGGAPFPGRLFTCGRPGRSLGKRVFVPDEIVESWIDGLPPAKNVHLISLLGAKEDGTLEYSFYTFRGGGELTNDRPTFQEWLDDRYEVDRFVVHDCPTVDAGDKAIPEECIVPLSNLILRLLTLGETVVLFDSAGSQRTRQFFTAAGFRRRPWPKADS
jgi:hypothetical protein